MIRESYQVGDSDVLIVDLWNIIYKFLGMFADEVHSDVQINLDMTQLQADFVHLLCELNEWNSEMK